jgi:hypothetical protein
MLTTSEGRKRTRFEFCEKHAPMFYRERRERQAEVCVEGGWAGAQGCEGGRCRLWPGRDFFVVEICASEYPLDWTTA